MNEITETKINAAVEMLWNAEQRGQTCSPVRELIGPNSIEAAYSIQSLITQRKQAFGRTIVGRKIGLTSEAVQRQIGVDQPDFGSLFDSGVLTNGSEVSMSDLMQPKIECEIAFTLAKSIPENASLDQIADAIGHGECSLEIAGSRVEGWDIRIADTIADNASASHFVLSGNKVRLGDIDLEGCGMKLFVNGVQKSDGRGAACLGNPLNAVQWLANAMAKVGSPLQAGEIILSGALGPMVAVNAGDHIKAEIDGMGTVEITIVE